MIITRELLQYLFDKHGTYKAILEAINLDPYAGGGYRTLKRYIKQYCIDLTNFSKLKASEDADRYKRLSKSRKKYTADNVFSQTDSVKVNNATIKQFMIRIGVEYKCTSCKIEDVYNNKPITLQVDHIDGNSKNNKLDNLRFLCPNCHSQTKTFGSKNRANKKKRGVTRTEFWHTKNGQLLESNRELIELVKNSDIDFSKYGWSNKVATLINKKPQKVAIWMRRYMPDFYETKCFKRTMRT